MACAKHALVGSACTFLEGNEGESAQMYARKALAMGCVEEVEGMEQRMKAFLAEVLPHSAVGSI